MVLGVLGIVFGGAFALLGCGIALADEQFSPSCCLFNVACGAVAVGNPFLLISPRRRGEWGGEDW